MIIAFQTIVKTLNISLIYKNNQNKTENFFEKSLKYIKKDLI